MADAVVSNLDEVVRAFEEAGQQFSLERQRQMEVIAGQPVAKGARTLAPIRIPTVTQPWSQFRTGVSGDVVWVGAVERGTRIRSRKRPKFAELLITRAMIPALDMNRERIVRAFDDLLERMEAKFNRG